MNHPDDPPDAAPNPFESPALPLPSEPEAEAGGETPERPVADPWERPTPAEMLTIVVSVFATLVVARRMPSMDHGATPLRTVAYTLLGLTLAALPLLGLRIKATSWRGISPGAWLWLGCACERCLYLTIPLLWENQYVPNLFLWVAYFTFLLRGACYSLPLFFSSGLWWRATSLLEVLWSLYTAAAFFMEPTFVNSTNRTLAHVAILITLTVAILVDWAQGVRYGWSHWCGLLVFVLWTANNLWPIIQAVSGL